MLTWSCSPPQQRRGQCCRNGFPTTSYTPNENFHGTDSFVIQVSDGNLTASATVNVQVTPVHDPLTGFISDNNLSMEENLDIGTVIGQIIASNPDDGNLVYKLVDENGSTDNNLFTLEQNGTLKTAVLFDYETNASTYKITVQATDEQNSSVKDDFTIKLLDVPENEAPQFQTDGNLSVLENESLVYEFNATDANGDTLSYSIENSKDSQFFQINTITGVLNFINAGL